jgi:hypothetical protein
MHDSLLFILAAVALVGVRLFIKLSGGSLAVVRDTAFGRRRARDRPMARIEAYWRAIAAPGYGLDERTSDDLDVADVFASVDHTTSTVGQQCLYARIRSGGADVADLHRLDAAAQRLADDEPARVVIAQALRGLEDVRAFSLPELFLRELQPRPAIWWLFPFLTIGAVASIVLIGVNPRSFFVVLAIAVANLALKFLLRARIDPVAAALHMTPDLIRAGRALATVQIAELDEPLAVIRANIGLLRGIHLASAWLAFEPGQGKEPMATFYAYANMLLGLDLNAYAFGIEDIRRRRAALRAVFDAIGAIDSALSVARWRLSLPVWSRPTFVERGKSLVVEQLVHPLVESAVPNDLCVDGHSVLVTGSNMSGKTTFIRAVGINAVLAQTLFTVLATRWEAPPFRVQSSIGRADDVLSGKSYYLAEVESIGGLVTASRDGRQHLFVIDEIFRGTNTTERVAAGRAVLAWLDDGDNIVLVATHDLELLELLAGRFVPVHFRERIEHDRLHFDYRLYAGVSSTRNAIALLRLMHFPDALVHDALATAARMGQRSPLAAQSPA